MFGDFLLKIGGGRNDLGELSWGSGNCYPGGFVQGEMLYTLCYRPAMSSGVNMEF